MNKLTIIGNLTRNPEQRKVGNDLTVTSFTVAVNRRRTNADHPEADYFRVTAWRQLGENCAKYLSKGRKVCVVGPVSVSAYTGKDGTTRATLEVTAEDVEFLSPKDEGGDLYETRKAQEKEAAYLKAEREGIQNDSAKAAPKQSKYVQVNDEELPF